MSQEIDKTLREWEFVPGDVQARRVRAGDGREVLQMRLDLGILQMEKSGRPDGNKPGGYPTYFDYLRHLARLADRSGEAFALTEEQCAEADREFMQYYQRRMCWLALREFHQAVADADHTLSFMDFVRTHSPSEDYTHAHEQYRGFVIFHRTQAAAAHALENQDPEAAVDAIHTGLDKLRDFFAAYDAEAQMDEDGMVQQLRKMETSLRKLHNIEATLQEQLTEAVANEDYEAAAKIRDAMKNRPSAAE